MHNTIAEGDLDEYLNGDFGSFSALIAHWGRVRGAAIAIDDGDIRLAWAELADQVERLAARLQADGLALPFAAATFDAVTVAFGLRNMASWEKALGEMNRVLRPGGLLVLLDFSLPPKGPLREIYRIYLHHILPRIAGWTTGRAEAYEYLGESIEAFPRGSGMAALIESCGFHCAPPRRMCLGIVSLYAARKPEQPPPGSQG